MKPQTFIKVYITFIVFWVLLAIFWILALVFDWVSGNGTLLSALWLFLAAANIVIYAIQIRRAKKSKEPLAEKDSEKVA